MKPGFKMLNGLCVPASTPDDYFERAVREWIQRQRNLAEVARYIRIARIAEFCAEHELESDEFYTAEEKAVQKIRVK